MIEKIVVISLMITGLHIVFSPGMLLSPVRTTLANYMDQYISKKWSVYLQKPLFSCLMCMASFWTIALTLSFDLKLILAVCGLNTVISRLIEVDEKIEDIPTLRRH